ncbi:MAG TPA: S1C family serine protease, partial [Planctomycetota bacterium]|nr:S1C family serine protease [Planctomycetota bacterium]
MSPACRSRLALSTLSVLGLAAGLLAQDEAEHPAARVTQVVAVVKRTGPAVVSVYSDGADPAAAPGGEGGEGGKGASLGSGLLIDADGFILTDTHVLPRGTEGIRVRLHDGGSFPATLVNLDLDNDVALLKISPRPGAPFA